MGLDGLVAQEEPGRDLGIGTPVDDELSDLELTCRQGLEPSAVELAGARAPVRPAAELSQLALCLVAVAESVEGVECRCGQFELVDGSIRVPCLGQCPSGEDACAGRVPQCLGPLEYG